MKRLLVMMMLLVFFAGEALAQNAPGSKEPKLKGNIPEVEVEPRLGAQIPLTTKFRDENARDVELGEYFRERPVLLALVYYECPMLCTLVLNGLVRGLKVLDLEPGKDFDVLVVSIDHEEGPALAREKKKVYLGQYGRVQTASGWHFLTGEQSEIAALAKSVGFGFVYQPEIDQWAHAAGVTILTKEGKVSRYLYGVDYAPRDLKFAFIDASQGTVASAVDRLLLLCFHYDPTAGKYNLAIFTGLRIGAVVTVLVLAAVIARMLLKESGRVARWS